jgi:predicted peroxiredoxin/TusA-related sulfurtransferase
MTAITAASSLDRRGKTITTFVIFDAAAALDRMREGEVLEILTDQFAPFEPDMQAWCQNAGHRLLISEPTPEGHRFLVEKGPGRLTDRKLAMIISEDGLLELLSPLAFALAAALEGTDVHLYFQGPAVKVLSKRYRPKAHGWIRPFTPFVVSGLNKVGHVPAQTKLHQLQSLGAHLYLCGGSMQPFKVKPEDIIFDDVPIVEYMTFMSIMRDADIPLYV